MSEFWPHQFTKIGPPVQVGVQQVYQQMKAPLMGQKMECVHCHTTYMHNIDPRPPDPCPARNDKREKKRILNNS